MYLGDRVESALTLVGVSPAKVSRWVGRPCHCAERKAKLNALDQHARRILQGKIAGAREYLDRLIS